VPLWLEHAPFVLRVQKRSHVAAMRNRVIGTNIKSKN